MQDDKIAKMRLGFGKKPTSIFFLAVLKYFLLKKQVSNGFGNRFNQRNKNE
jgi:hypothetical protein